MCVVRTPCVLTRGEATLATVRRAMSVLEAAVNVSVTHISLHRIVHNVQHHLQTTHDCLYLVTLELPHLLIV